MCMEAPKEWVRAMYVSESFAEKDRNQKLLESYTYELVSDKVFAAVSDTQTPQGILAVVEMPEYQLSDLLRGEKTHLLILESIQDPGNLGTMLRTGEGAGVTGVIMNRTTADLFNPKTIRSTMGSIYRMPFVVTENLNATVLQLKNQGVSLYAAHLKGTCAYDEPDYTGSCGFFIGNEVVRGGESMRIWFKIWDDTHLIRTETIEDERDETRTHKIFDALEEACYRFDLGKPIWLDANVEEFKRHAKTRFGKDNFVEEIDFDYLEMQVIEED